MNYRYVNVSSGICNVVENITEQTVKSGIPAASAREMTRHLNLGGGFDGFTPAFFLEAFPLFKDSIDF